MFLSFNYWYIAFARIYIGFPFLSVFCGVNIITWTDEQLLVQLMPSQTLWEFMALERSNLIKNENI